MVLPENFWYMPVKSAMYGIIKSLLKYRVVNSRSLTIFIGAIVLPVCYFTIKQTQAQRCNLSEVSELKFSDSRVNDNAGYAVSLFDNVAVVGVPQWSYNHYYGKVNIFRHNGINWIEEANLSPPDGEYDDEFGYSLAQSDDCIVVGSLYDDDMGVDSGSAYIYRFDMNGNNEWSMETKITAPDGSANDNFARSISIFEDILVIGAMNDDDNGMDSGSVYIYRYDRENTRQWILDNKINPSDSEAGDRFGYAVSISSNDVIVIGAPFDNGDEGYDFGSAYIFRYDQDGSQQWIQQEKLTAGDGRTNDYFGCDVSISGDVVIVGSEGDNNENGKDAGSAYIFKYNSNGSKLWTWVDKLTASNGQEDDNFGHAVSIAGKNVVVGAIYGDNDGINTGTAHIFRNNPFSNKRWLEVAKLRSSNSEPEDQFGNSVSVSGDKVVVGAPYNDDIHEDSGIAYIFDVDCPVLTVLPTPLKSGQNSTFTVTNAKPYTTTYLVGTVFGTGETYVPLLDVTLDLNRPKLIADAVASDQDGTAQWIILINENVEDINVWLQAVQYSLKTNVVATSIIP